MARLSIIGSKKASKKLSKPVVGRCLKTLEVKNFKSCTDAEKLLRPLGYLVNFQNISDCANGGRKTCGGWTWEWHKATKI